MERRAFLLSLGLSVFATFLVYSYIRGEEEKLKKAYGEFTSIVVSTRDVLQFESIRPTDVEVIKVPMALYHPAMINDPNDVIDAVAAIPISKGEQILDTKIISRNVYSGLDTQIAQSKRAISIPVNPRSSIAYHLRPGNRVDLAAHFEYRTQGQSISEVKVFLQDILVLASGRTIQPTAPKGVDQAITREISKNSNASEPAIKETLNFAKSDSGFQTVTLEVTPEQSQHIVYVMTVFADSIILLLRHSDDRQLERVSTTNLVKIMGNDSYFVRGPKVPSPRAVPKPKFMDIVGGEAKFAE